MESLPLFLTGTLLAAGFYWFFFVYGSPERKGKSSVSLSGGSISSDKLQNKYEQYWSFFRRPEKTDAGEKEKVPDFVDTFYNLVTDIYEWGWGQSFHFARPIPGKSYKESTRAHEEMVADLVAVKPGARILDVGCGVGGPMRTIAAHSGANVVGITINDYQVERARQHNKKAGLDSVCEVVCGNFLQMPFSEETFDGAYAIEATCHAPRLEDVYGEVYRVLKPGSVFVSLEWVSTDKYDAGNPEQVKIVEEIARGNALPGVKSYADVGKAAKKVGFEVLKEEDLAKPPALPWWARLKMGRIAYQRNHILVTVLSALRIAPKGTLEVHEMLVEAADYLRRAGEAGIFSPMHLIVCRKPESSKSC